MERKSSIITMSIITLIFFIFFLIGITRIDPRTAQLIGFVSVTVALLLFLWGFIGTFMLAQKTIRKKDFKVAVSLRQASFLSFVIVFALYLSRFDLLTWWNIFILIGIVAFLEVYFIGKEEV
jgi:uncharacterized membrane protein